MPALGGYYLYTKYYSGPKKEDPYAAKAAQSKTTTKSAAQPSKPATTNKVAQKSTAVSTPKPASKPATTNTSTATKTSGTKAVTGGSAGSNTSPVQKVVNAVKAATTATVKAATTTAVQVSNQVATTVKTVSEKIINTVDTVKKEVSAAATSTVNKVMQTAANQASSIKQNTAEAVQKLTNVATAAVKTPQKTAVTLGQQVMKQTTVAMQEMPKYTGATQYIQKPTTSFTPTPAMPAKDVMTTASLLTATYLNNKINSDLNGLRKAAVNSFSVDKWMDTAAGEIYNYIANISNPFFVATTGGKLIVDPLFRNMSLKESLQESIAFSKGYNGASLKMLQGAVEGLLSLPETMDSLKKCIDENGIKQTAKDIACSVVEDAVKIWEEDIKNGNARSRGEIIGDFRMLVGGKILGDALVAARAGKLATKLDDVSGLGKAADKVTDAGKYVKGGLDTLSTPNSKKLRQNLIEAGVEVPNYPNAAHHIVAGSSPKAAQARAIMQKYGVDINDAANGTFLPTVKNVAEGAYHPSLHTDSYYRKVTELLSSARSRDDVLDILDDIAEQLQNGKF